MGKALGYAVFLLASTIVGLVQARRAKREGRESAAAADQVAPWAASAGFEVVDPFDLEVHELAHEALMLLENDNHREIGTALRRRHTRGVLYLFDSFRTDGQGDRAVTCVMTTSASLHELIGEDVLAGLPRGSFLQRAPGRIALHVPVPLEQRLARVLAERLSHFEATMPGVPGSARL